MRIYWCTKCKEGIPKNLRQLRAKPHSGWVCPTCGIGLPRMPMLIIEEEIPISELLKQQ